MMHTCPTLKWTQTSGVKRPGRRNASPWRSSPMSLRNIMATNSSSQIETSFQLEVSTLAFGVHARIFVHHILLERADFYSCSYTVGAAVLCIFVSLCHSPPRTIPQPCECKDLMKQEVLDVENSWKAIREGGEHGHWTWEVHPLEVLSCQSWFGPPESRQIHMNELKWSSLRLLQMQSDEVTGEWGGQWFDLRCPVFLLWKWCQCVNNAWNNVLKIRQACEGGFLWNQNIVALLPFHWERLAGSWGNALTAENEVVLLLRSVIVRQKYEWQHKTGWDGSKLMCQNSGFLQVLHIRSIQIKILRKSSFK